MRWNRHNPDTMKTRRLWALLFVAVLVGCSETGISFGPLRATPTLTPTLTPSATPTPTLTPTPTPSPTPTPLPAEALDEAQQAAHIGDWEAAKRAFQDVRSRPDVLSEESEAATLGLAQVLVADQAYTQVLALLDDFVAPSLSAAGAVGPPLTEPETTAHAHLLYADALRASGQPLTATLHYSEVLRIEPLLSPYVYQWIGDALYAAGSYTQSAIAYTSAVTEAETASRTVWMLEKLAAAHAAAGNGTGALDAYDAILSIAQIPEYRARIMYQAAETALAFGSQEDGYRRMIELAAAYPEEDQAYDAMVRLVEAGQPVDDRLRGIVDYHGEAYGPAIEAFYRIILGDPDHDGEPHYYAGLSFLEMGSYQEAMDEFDLLIGTHPGDPYVPDAWIAKARALVAQAELDAALTAYQSGIEQYAAQQQVPQGVWDLVGDLEDAGAFAMAADVLLDVAARYPNDERAPEARFRAGLARYRADDVEGASAAWQEAAAWYPYAEQTQATWFWLGKTYLAAGQSVSATHALTSAMDLGPWDFYGLQAADLLEEREPFEALPDALVACDGPEAVAEAEDWLSSWLGLLAEEDPTTLPASLLDDPRLRRGTRLLEMGHFDEGRDELEKLRVATADDPLTQYRLALYFRDVGLYRSSIIAAATLWRLSPAEDLAALPKFIGCLVYPTYYDGLVESEAAAHGLSPLLVYSLVRQESLFEGYATSFAAAHGLMQVIPSTGAYIAEALDWPRDYETRDLYRPMVSVRFGTFYLAEQRDLVENNLFAALAAYNGGPGNALRWWDEAGGDPHLFVELIDFSETRRYVRYVREHYAGYRYLYGGPWHLPPLSPILRRAG
ncbi:MAG: transglycosylase SLT domain-containing protein [Anaerolineae bacterium]